MLKKVVRYGALILLLIPVFLFWYAYRGERKPSNESEVALEENAHSNDKEKEKSQSRKIKYWVAPMDPNYIRHEPGKSPMGMDLVPVYEDEGEKSSEGVIRIDPVTVQTIGVRTASVTRGQLRKSIRAVGRIAYDEKRVEHIHTKVTGWVEKLYVQTTGEEVKRGQVLLSFYSPELVATQEEYLQALKYRDRTSASSFPEVAESGSSLVAAARRRLEFMDVDSAQIKALEETREVQKNIMLKSTREGIVIHKNVMEGMKVDSMMEMYTIADLSVVWVIASIYEYELSFLKTGQDVEMTLSYDPGTRYRGKVAFIYPFLSNNTRTVQVRMEFDNPGLKLKPDMYVDVAINAKPPGSELLVPSEAVLRTGSRNVVITALEKGKFLPKEVTIGLEGEGLVQILEGLTGEESVVTSGQFLIDSESNLREAVNKMLEVSAGAPAEDSMSSEGDKEEGKQAAVSAIAVNDEQKKIISDLLAHYLKVHKALVSESGMDVAEKTHEMHSVLEKLKASDTEGTMKAITDSMDSSMEGLHSGDLQTARTSFKTLSRTMTELIKGAVREEALSEDIKIYVCPMENEPWIQKGSELRNPYLGKDMWICGVEESY
jgi:Cu(I)/Ag(I) efflux system membrane fusion protein/cobalt-zinc-cadmium efflux system membrane fusion protein